MKSKVLIIEGSAEILENIVEILQLQQFEVVAARDADSGMELVDREKPDVILCDILVPGNGGFDVLNHVRYNSAKRSVPFIFVTSQTGRGDIQKALDLGASAYIVKPFDGQALIDSIKGFLRASGNRANDDSPGSTLPDLLLPAEGK